MTTSTLPPSTMRATRPERRPPVLRPVLARTDAQPSWLEWIGPTFVGGWPVVWPAPALFVVTLLLRNSRLDLVISQWFYDPVARTWPWFATSVCTLFYRGGIYPAFALAFAGIGLGLWSLIAPWSRGRYLRAGTFLWLAFFLGPGLIVNIGLKGHWGRPRPHQVAEFGGKLPFVAVGSRSRLEQENRSFPSGHAAVAFFMIAPAFLVDRRRPQLARKLLMAGLLFGTAMSAVRVVQGGHFASDVLWSAAIVYFTCVVCARLLLNPRSIPTVSNPASRARSIPPLGP